MTIFRNLSRPQQRGLGCPQDGTLAELQGATPYTEREASEEENPRLDRG